MINKFQKSFLFLMHLKTYSATNTCTRELWLFIITCSVESIFIVVTSASKNFVNLEYKSFLFSLYKRGTIEKKMTFTFYRICRANWTVTFFPWYF